MENKLEEHVQLRSGVQKSAYFENSCSNSLILQLQFHSFSTRCPKSASILKLNSSKIF